MGEIDRGLEGNFTEQLHHALLMVTCPLALGMNDCAIYTHIH